MTSNVSDDDEDETVDDLPDGDFEVVDGRVQVKVVERRRLGDLLYPLVAADPYKGKYRNAKRSQKKKRKHLRQMRSTV